MPGTNDASMPYAKKADHSGSKGGKASFVDEKANRDVSNDSEYGDQEHGKSDTPSGAHRFGHSGDGKTSFREAIESRGMKHESHITHSHGPDHGSDNGEY